MTFVDITPQSQIDRTRALAQSIGRQALQFRPIAHPLQGLAQLANAASGALLSARADRQQRERQKAGTQALAALAQPGTSPNVSQLLQTVAQFPELSPTLQPLIAAQLQPAQGQFSLVEDPTALGLPPGTVAQRGPRGEIKIVSTPESDVVSPEREAQLMRLAAARQEEFRVQTGVDPATGQPTFTLVRGPAGRTAPTTTKPTVTRLEKSVTDATEALDRINRIEESFDESLLELPTQVRNSALRMADRLGIDLSDEQREQIQKSTRLQTTTLNNLNRTINALSGAAVSAQEAERIKGELPTMADSPEQFRTKVATVRDMIGAAIRRSQGLLESGVTDITVNRKTGDIEGAPDLDTFMILEEEARTIEATPAPPAGFVLE